MKIDLLYSGWLTAPNGVSSFLRVFKSSSNFFKEKKVNFSIFSADIFVRRDFEKSKKQSLKNIAIIIIKKFIPKSKTLTIWFLKKTEINHIKIVNYYNKNNTGSDFVFFHELLTCYHYFKTNPDNTSKVVLVLHTNGDTFKMLNIYYPKLKRTSYFKYLLEVEDYVINKVDKLGFVSKSSMLNFIDLKKEDLDNSKFFYVHNGIPKLDFIKDKIYNPKYRFCCAGSITKRKGQEIILKAFNLLSNKEKEEFSFVFLGDGEEKNNLINYAIKNGISKYVTFLGTVNSNIVEKHLKSCNCYILTSFDEGLPISILEAMRSSMAIISTRVGGIPEMVEHNKNGFLINPNEKELFDFFKTINNYDINKMGVNSKLIFNKKFSSEFMLENYLEIFTDLQR